MVQSLRRHPLMTFFVLAFCITWVVWIPRAAGTQLGVLGQLWTWVPAIAALIAAALTGGGAAVRDLGARLVRWRVGWQWYLVTIVGPAVFSLAVAGVYVLLGGSWATAAPPALREGALFLLPLFLLALVLTDGLGEELAWRGFALPRLLLRHKALAASLILRVLGAVAPSPGLDGGGHNVSTTHLAVLSRYTGEVGPLHLGLPAHPRKRTPRNAVARLDQHVRRVAEPDHQRRHDTTPDRRGGEVVARRRSDRSSRSRSCTRSPTRGVASGLSRDVLFTRVPTVRADSLASRALHPQNPFSNRSETVDRGPACKYIEFQTKYVAKAQR